MGKKLLLLFLSTLVSLLILEAFARFGSLDKLDSHLKFINCEDYPNFRFRPSKITGYEFIPNCSPEINSLGFYDKEYNVFKASGVYRILVIGDSITASNRYPAFLEIKLNNQSKGRLKFEVWNCAIPGIGIRQYANFLISKGIEYDPDMVIIGFCLSDFEMYNPVVYRDADNMIEYWNPFPRLSRRFMNRFLYRYSSLYRFVMLRLENILYSELQDDLFKNRREEGVFFLNQIKEITFRNKIKLVGIIFPYMKALENYTEFHLNDTLHQYH